MRSHAEGEGTVAKGFWQHVEGKYNIIDEGKHGAGIDGQYLHIVGNGSGDSSRSNAHTLDWSGNGWYAGDVYVGKDNKKLATEEFVNTALKDIETALDNIIAKYELGGDKS
jgi:hypothetical protein